VFVRPEDSVDRRLGEEPQQPVVVMLRTGAPDDRRELGPQLGFRDGVVTDPAGPIDPRRAVPAIGLDGDGGPADRLARPGMTVTP
jgi:hypothetical protein